MYFVDNNSAVPVMPAVKPVVSSTPLFFTEGGNGVPPTWPGPDWFNIVQTELLNLLKEAGMDPDKVNHAQLLAAMKALFLTRSNPFGDIAADGPAAIAQALSNLGLGDAASKNVGTTAGTVAAGDDSRIVNAVQPSNHGLCNAYVNFSGVGGATIRNSHNVSSVTRISAGRYKISFATPMSNATYVPMLTIGDGDSTGSAAPIIILSGSGINGTPVKDANSITIGIRSSVQATYDANEINAAFFGG